MYAAEVGLTTQQRAFAEALISDPTKNKALAATKAGYASPMVTGCKLAKHPKVLEYMRLVDTKATQEAEKQAKKDQLKANDVVMGVRELKRRMTDIARGGLTSYVNQAEGTLDLTKLNADDKGHLVKKLMIGKSGVKAEATDPLSALRSLGEHYKLFDSKQAVAPQINFMQVVQGMQPVEQAALSKGLEHLYRAMLSTAQVVDVESEEV
jgi:phage terminase small subunit